MTDATTENLDALVTAYVYGELSADAKAAFEEQMRSDPDLQAEVDGLLAMRDVLDADAQFGEESGIDEPPPHLFDAILKDEAIARSPAVKAAVAKRNAPPSEGLLSKLSTWLVGGGALAGAAAVLFFVVARQGAVDDVAAPQAAKTAAPAAADIKRDAPSGLEKEAAREEKPGSFAAKSERAPAELSERELAKGALDVAPRPSTITSSKDRLDTGRGSAGGGGFAPEPERKKSDKKVALPPRGSADDAPAEARRSRHRDAPADGARSDPAQGNQAGEGTRSLSFGTHQVGIDSSLSLEDDDSADEAKEVVQKPKPKPAPAVALGDNVERQAPSAKAEAEEESIEAPVALGGRAGAAKKTSASASGAAPAAEPPAAPPPPPAADSAAGPPRLNEKTAEFARKQREAAAKRAPMKAKRGKNKRDSYKANAKREARLRKVEQTIMAAATELAAQRSASALALFQRAELEGSGLKEIGLGPVLGQMQALLQQSRKKEALALAVKGERAAKGTIGKDDVIATGARVATDLQNRPRARSLWNQLLNSPRFKAEAKRSLRALEFDADMFDSEAPAVRSRR